MADGLRTPGPMRLNEGGSGEWAVIPSDVGANADRLCHWVGIVGLTPVICQDVLGECRSHTMLKSNWLLF